MRRWTAAAVVLALAAARPAVAVAQVPADTLPPDSLAVDTAKQTARYLEAQQKATIAVPVMPHLGTTALQPARSRVIFDRDSIDWLHGLTLGDLLAQIPGTYVWRGGWYGRAESINYRAQGVVSTEYYLDGVPYLPAGVDSVGVDPAFISLSFLERVEVERFPDRLRVHLFTKRHDRLVPRSRIAITTGDADIARYEGSLEQRTTSGFGFALAADYFSSPTVSANESRYSNNHLWLQGSYIPSRKFGIRYQLIRSTPKRRPYAVNIGVDTVDTLSLGYEATRTDGQLRLSYHTRPDGLGAAVDLIYARTGWSSDIDPPISLSSKLVSVADLIEAGWSGNGNGHVDQSIHQVGGILSFRSPTFSTGGSAFYRSRWTPFDARANAGWSPTAPLTVSAEAVLQAHDEDRASRWALLRAALEPIQGLAFTGSARVGREVAAPAIATDTTQEVRDYEAQASWQSPRLGLDLVYTRTSAFAPVAPAEFRRIPTIGTVPSSEWLTLAVRLAPLRWLTLESWYSDPRSAAGIEGVPPTHSLTRGTIRSKFLRTFPSGAFDLKLQVTMESWGTGIIGHDATNSPVELRGATFVSSLVQFQIGTFSFFWDRGNLTTSQRTYIPGFRIPPYGTTYGVRWSFWN